MLGNCHTAEKAMKTFVEGIMGFRLENIRVMDDVNGWRCVLCVCMLYDDMLCGGSSFCRVEPKGNRSGLRVNPRSISLFSLMTRDKTEFPQGKRRGTRVPSLPLLRWHRLFLVRETIAIFPPFFRRPSIPTVAIALFLRNEC